MIPAATAAAAANSKRGQIQLTNQGSLRKKGPIGKLVRKEGKTLIFDGNLSDSDEEGEIWDDFDDSFDLNQELPLWPKTKNTRYFIYLLLSEPLSSKIAQAVSIFILFAIMFSVLLFVIETLPHFKEDRGDQEPKSLPFFVIADYTCMTIFVAEYFLRIVCATGTPQHQLDPSLPTEEVPEDQEAHDKEMMKENDTSITSNASSTSKSKEKQKKSKMKHLDVDVGPKMVEEDGTVELKVINSTEATSPSILADAVPKNTEAGTMCDTSEMKSPEIATNDVTSEAKTEDVKKGSSVQDLEIDIPTKTKMPVESGKVAKERSFSSHSSAGLEEEDDAVTAVFDTPVPADSGEVASSETVRRKESFEHVRVMSNSTVGGQSSRKSVTINPQTKPYELEPVATATFTEMDMQHYTDETAAKQRCLGLRAWCMWYCICCNCCHLGCGMECCRMCLSDTWNIFRYCKLCDAEWRAVFIATSKQNQPDFWELIYRPIWKMWIFFKQPLNLIDFVAILPFLLGLVFDATSFGGDTAFNPSVVLRTFRLARVFRVLKLSKHTKAVNLFFNVLRRSSGPLGLLAFFLALCVIVFGSIVYSSERGKWNADMRCYVRKDTFTDEQEDFCTPFSDMLMAFYWVFVTITTVGYGDIYPMSGVGRIVAIVCMLVGVVGFAMPITVISSSFQEEYELLKTRRRKEYANTRVENWDEETVCTWLADIANGRLKEYAPVFKQEQIRGDILELLTEEHLEYLGLVTKGERLTFLRAVENLRKSDFEPDPLVRLKEDLEDLGHHVTSVIRAVKLMQHNVNHIRSFNLPEVHTPSFVPRLPQVASAHEDLLEFNLTPDVNKALEEQTSPREHRNSSLHEALATYRSMTRSTTRGHVSRQTTIYTRQQNAKKRLAFLRDAHLGYDVPSLFEMAEWDYHSV